MFLAKLNEARALKNVFLTDRWNAFSIGVSVVLNIIHWLILSFKVSPGRDMILLRFNVLYGADYVDQSRYAYLTPLIATAFLLVNIILGVFFHKRERLASLFINASGVFVQVVFLIASLIVIQINEY
jgi:hypothetical protein